MSLPDSSPLVVAAVQMSSVDQVDANLRRARDLVAEAGDAGARLVVLPENFAAMGARETLRRELAEADGRGPIQDALAAMAQRYGVWIVGGTIPILAADDPRPAAACSIYNSDGERVGRYDKIHLFDVDVPGGGESYRESANTAPGARPLTVPTPWGRLGVAVCYDMRFPELFRRLADESADLVAVPAAFTWPTGSAHWEVLLRSRAIENLAYVVAAAQTGTHPGGRRTWGHSMVVGPWGEILADAGSAPGVALSQVDMERLDRLRAEFPVLHHRRLPAAPAH